MSDYYLYLKALHIIFVTSWFAGLFYLPRIFVNLAMVEEPATYQHLLLMAKKLYRFITPIMLLTFIFGGWMLYLNPSLLTNGWMQVKLALVSLLIGYHLGCGIYIRRFSQQSSSHTHIYYRWFNELPVIILVAIVFLAVTKSF